MSSCFHQELLGVLSDKLTDIESELRTGFHRMERLMKEQASDLMESIRAVHMQVCATQRGIRSLCPTPTHPAPADNLRDLTL